MSNKSEATWHPNSGPSGSPLAVSIDRANRIIFPLCDENDRAWDRVEAARRELERAEVEQAKTAEVLSAKKAELKAVGYSFNRLDGVYPTGERPRHEGLVRSVRDIGGY